MRHNTQGINGEKLFRLNFKIVFGVTEKIFAYHLKNCGLSFGSLRELNPLQILPKSSFNTLEKMFSNITLNMNGKEA